MTDFEKQVRKFLLECIEEVSEVDDELESEGVQCVSHRLLCDTVFGSILSIIGDKIKECIPEGAEYHAGYITNKCVPGTVSDYYTVDSLVYCYMEIDCVHDTGEVKPCGHTKDGRQITHRVTEEVGELRLIIKYNTTEDCEDLIKYKFIPVGTDEYAIDWVILH